MDSLNCPYCNAIITIDNSCGDYPDDGTKHQKECPKCEKWFVFETEVDVIFNYEPSKAPCLNENEDAGHDWKQHHGYWQCKNCEKVTQKEPNIETLEQDHA